MQTLPKTPLAALIALLLASCGPLVGAGVAVGAEEIAEDEDGGMGCFEGASLATLAIIASTNTLSRLDCMS